MKVIRVARPGPPDVLTCLDEPEPAPQPHEVLVKARAIGVGIPDLLIRAGTYPWMPKLPAVPGTELSGRVEAVGTAVSRYRVGDRVLVSARENNERGGCYAEFVTAAEDAVFALPDGIDMDGAAALANYQLVHLMLTDAARVAPGQTILVHAAAGGVGSALVDVGSGMGLNIIGIAKGAEKVAFVRAFGAMRAIDRAQENIAEAIAEATGGRGVDVIFDAVGGPTFADNIRLLGHLGQVVSYGALAGQPQGDLLGAMREHRGKSPSVRIFSIHAYDKRREDRRGAMTWAIDALAQGRIHPAIHARVPLAEAKRAHEMVEAGLTRGKVLLRP